MQIIGNSAMCKLNMSGESSCARTWRRFRANESSVHGAGLHLERMSAGDTHISRILNDMYRSVCLCTGKIGI